MKLALATAAAIALAPAALSAATLTVTDVTGEWIALDGTPASPDGLGTSAVSWGTPWNGGPQSGYEFEGATSTANLPNTDFVMGIFTHNNNTITAGTSITGATLRVAFSFFIDTAPGDIITRIAEFRFDHNETPNGAEPCADGGANGAGVNVNGCADEVTVRTNPNYREAFEIEGVRYVFDVTGFQVGSSFWTTERRSNATQLTGRFTEEANLAPAPIPLPAAGWMLLAALGAAGAAGFRRRGA